MAFVSGSAANVTDLVAAIINAVTANGWAATAADVVSMGDAYLKITADTANDRVVARAGLGYSAGTLVTPAPADTYLDHPLTTEPWTWPVSYKIHMHGAEVYVVANWGVDKYSLLAFGQSNIAGAPGTGVWVSGTGVQYNAFSFIAGSVPYHQGFGSCSTGLFIGNSAVYGNPGTFLHSSFGSASGWNITDSGTELPYTHAGSRALHYLDNPSVNPTGQTVLVPIQPHIDRGSSKRSIVADLLHARYVRLDTLTPGAVVIFGADKWMVYPVYKKDTANRNGTGGAANSGTFGYAIRYDGP